MARRLAARPSFGDTGDMPARLRRRLPSQDALSGEALEPKDSLREPPWWVRDVIVAVLIGLMLTLAQWTLDNRRSDREDEREDQRALDTLQIENLRFVRERSGPSDIVRPFESLDLRGMNISGLDLGHADFTDALLSQSDMSGMVVLGGGFIEANLDGAKVASLKAKDGNFTGASIRDVRFWAADLRGARWQEALLEDVAFVETTLRAAEFGDVDLARVTFNKTDLRAADLYDVRGLDSANLDRICWDDNTFWPDGFTPPERWACGRHDLSATFFDEEYSPIYQD